jgi:uncharacterized membrane protein YGL010W
MESATKYLVEQLESYAAYHRDGRNKLTHFIGVPLVVFGILLALGWLRFVHAPQVPVTGATVCALVVFLYYLCLDWKIAVGLAPFGLCLLLLADWLAQWPLSGSASIFLATFGGGWAILMLGHWFEARRPALADNILQMFNAPLFLAVEVAFLFGCREDLRNRTAVLR